MPCVEETEKATEMPRGLLPPRLWLLASLHFLLSRTSKAESLAIVSSPPSPFAWGGRGGLNYSRLRRLNKLCRGARRGAPARVSPATVRSARLLPPAPPRALQGGLGEPPRIDNPELRCLPARRRGCALTYADARSDGWGVGAARKRYPGISQGTRRGESS